MPEATLNAVADHGRIPGHRIEDTYAESHQVLDELDALGIDYDEVVQLLEDEGVAKFEASWDELGGKLTAALDGQDQDQRHADARKD